MLTRPYTGSRRDPVAFALACQSLAAEVRRTKIGGRLLGARGEVLAEVDDRGRFTPTLSLSDASEPPGDGWYRTRDEVVCYVHQGRPFSLRRGERLAVAPLDALPEDAFPVVDDEVDAFQQAGGERIEAFCARGGA